MENNFKNKVYIAGKLNDMAVDYLHNVHKMMQTAEKARLAGYAPFTPAIDLLMGIKFGYTDYHDYFDVSQPWLAVADAVLLVPGFETSKGTFEELQRASNFDIPIYKDVHDLMHDINRVRSIVQDKKSETFKFKIVCY